MSRILWSIGVWATLLLVCTALLSANVGAGQTFSGKIVVAHGPFPPPDPKMDVAHGPFPPPDPKMDVAHGPFPPPDPKMDLV